jgi:hypothetical protein
MNYALKEEGFLSGEPGAYSVTEKGAKFAAEQGHHRGTGGYDYYNRWWETRTWDDSVAGELNLSDDRKRQIRQAISDQRRTARAARSEAAVVADRARHQMAAVADRSRSDAVGARVVDIDALAKPVLLAAAAAYGIYKAVPLARKLWNENAAPGLKGLEGRVQPKPDTGDEAGTDDNRGACD